MKSYLMLYALADAVLSVQLRLQRVGNRVVRALIATHEALRRAGHVEYARMESRTAPQTKDGVK